MHAHYLGTRLLDWIWTRFWSANRAELRKVADWTQPSVNAIGLTLGWKWTCFYSEVGLLFMFCWNCWILTTHFGWKSKARPVQCGQDWPIPVQSQFISSPSANILTNWYICNDLGTISRTRIIAKPDLLDKPRNVSVFPGNQKLDWSQILVHVQMTQRHVCRLLVLQDLCHHRAKQTLYIQYQQARK